VTKQCWDCGFINAPNANFCGECGKRFNSRQLAKHDPTTMLARSADNIGQGRPHEYQARQREYERNVRREEFRSNELFWNFLGIGRFLSRIEVHRTEKQLEISLEDLEDQMEIELRAVEAQQSIRHRNSQIELHRAKLQLYDALNDFAEVVQTIGSDVIDEEAAIEQLTGLVERYLERVHKILAGSELVISAQVEEQTRRAIIAQVRAKLMG
jgi:hypothetical protein